MYYCNITIIKIYKKVKSAYAFDLFVSWLVNVLFLEPVLSTGLVSIVKLFVGFCEIDNSFYQSNHT